MPFSISQLIASADTAGDALRLIRAAKDLTQAEVVARAEGSIGVDQISLIERGKRPMTSKQCTAIAGALNLTDAQEAQLMLLALIDRAPERLKPTLRQARLRSTLATVEAFLLAYPPEKMEAFITTMDAVAEVWTAVKARGKSSQHAENADLRPSKASRGGTEHGVRFVD
jgi:transcriptional regulator with XRE-family HTH domain